jgi:hypothetical protein
MWIVTQNTGVYGCFEVTIGFNVKHPQRVDYMTYTQKKNEFRCYEIKISKADFHSKCHNSFVGHWNYYVLTKELYEQVKSEIPSHIGVYVNKVCVKKAKRQELTMEMIEVLKDSMMRSLCREFQKQYNSQDESIVARLNRSASRYKSERNKYKKLYEGLLSKKGD